MDYLDHLGRVINKENRKKGLANLESGQTHENLKLIYPNHIFV